MVTLNSPPLLTVPFLSFFFFFFFYGHTQGIWKFPGGGLHPSRSCNLCHSFHNPGYFNLLCRARDQTHSSTVTGATAVGFFFIFFFCFVLSFIFLGPHLWHMEVPRLGVKLEFYLPATATAMWNLSHVCDLHHSSWQCWVLNPLSEARD